MQRTQAAKEERSEAVFPVLSVRLPLEAVTIRLVKILTEDTSDACNSDL